MSKLSEYVPLLIIIASVIISLIGKKKRPVNEILLPEEVFPEPESPFIREKPDTEKKITTSAAPRIRFPEKKSHFASRAFAESQENGEYESVNIDLSEQDEVKKAIIYTEIFNRKDF
jgi:hypothetical protein